MDIKQLHEKLEEIKKRIDPESVFVPTDIFFEEHVWMIKLKNDDESLFEEIISEGITLTSDFFNISYAEVNELLFGSIFEYNKEQAPIVMVFYLYLRYKMPGFRQ